MLCEKYSYLEKKDDLQVVKETEGTQVVFKLMATGLSLADLSTNFITILDRETGKVGFSCNNVVIESGSPVLFSADEKKDLQRFIPEVDDSEKISLRCVDTAHGYLSVDGKKYVRTQTDLTSEPSGVLDQDSKLAPSKWAKFDLVKVAPIFVNLGAVRIKSDADHIEYYNVISSIKNCSSNTSYFCRSDYL